MNANWITNKDGSIYHLGLHKDQVATNIITVGDQNRVAAISKYFDKIEHQISNREFITHTGYINDTRITVISTGIGTDNIDIVINELDALFNVNLETGQALNDFNKLNFVRIGTSGTIQKDIPIDSFLISKYALGLDNLMHFYKHKIDEQLIDEIRIKIGIKAYISKSSDQLLKLFSDKDIFTGNTVTCAGFYGPQGRSTRLESTYESFIALLQSANLSIGKITNLEMETAGIYGLCNALGHDCISLNAILANRASNTFSNQVEKTIDKLIQRSIEKIVSI
jgi:uridine phosphorylase